MNGTNFNANDCNPCVPPIGKTPNVLVKVPNLAFTFFCASSRASSFFVTTFSFTIAPLDFLSLNGFALISRAPPKIPPLSSSPTEGVACLDVASFIFFTFLCIASTSRFAFCISLKSLVRISIGISIAFSSALTKSVHL